jgi:hypothetical protein
MIKGKEKALIIIALIGIAIINTSLCNGMSMSYSLLEVQNSAPLQSSTPPVNNTATTARGAIASLQNDQNGNQIWIVQGHWEMSLARPLWNAENVKNIAKMFSASLLMVSLNGSKREKNSISDFNQTNATVKSDGSQITLNGTAVVTTKKSGRFEQVPVSISIIRNNAISIWIDPRIVNNYFGKTPIYGITFQTT